MYFSVVYALHNTLISQSLSRSINRSRSQENENVKKIVFARIFVEVDRFNHDQNDDMAQKAYISTAEMRTESTLKAYCVL